MNRSSMAQPLICPSCGYDLRSHARDAVCPECGESIGLHVERERRTLHSWHLSLGNAWRLVVASTSLSTIATVLLVILVADASQSPTTVTPVLATAVAGLTVAAYVLLAIAALGISLSPRPHHSRILSMVALVQLLAGLATVPCCCSLVVSPSSAIVCGTALILVPTTVSIGLFRAGAIVALPHRTLGAMSIAMSLALAAVQIAALVDLPTRTLGHHALAIGLCATLSQWLLLPPISQIRSAVASRREAHRDSEPA